MKNYIKDLYKNNIFNWCVTALSVVFLPLIFQCLAQFLLKRSFIMTVEYLWIYRRPMLLGTVFLILVMASITVITRRVVIPAVAVGSIIYALSTAHFFKLYFREESLMPSDLYLIKEAGLVAGELDLFITREIILFGGFLVLMAIMLFKVKIPKTKLKLEILIRLAISSVFMLSAVLYTKTVLYDDNVLEKIGAGMGSLNNEETYYKGTFVTAFLRFTQDAFYEEPDGYSKEAVREIYSTLKVTDNTDQKKPDIIVVMLEGYFHLDYYDKETYSENIMENYDRISREGIRGNHIAATFGGGTADIEFEVLTAHSKMLLPDVGTAYNTVVKPGIDSYVSYLKKLDYRAIAIHSYLGTLYNRVAAYRNLGFDQFYDFDDFAYPQMAGQYISDMATMDKIIEIYEEEIENINDGNVFIHTVTMQNHAPIDNRFTEDEQIEVYSERMNAQDKNTLANLATCQYLTDQAIGYLVDYFRTVDRDVIVLFFGDHQVKASRETDKDPLKRTDFYTDYSSSEQTLKLHSVPFLMWSNFEVKDGEDIGLISTDSILPNMLTAYNVVRPDYFDYVYHTQSVIKGYIKSTDMVINPDGSTTFGLTEEQKKVRLERSYIEYDAVLGEKIIDEYYYN